MKRPNLSAIVIATTCVLGVSQTMPGCAGSPEAAREQARLDIRTFRSELVTMPAQIDRTVNTLAQLTSQATSNRAEVLTQLGREITRMQSHGRLLNQQAELASKNSDRYFDAWARELEASSDAADREQGKAALSARKLGYETALDYLNNGRSEYRRFLKDLQDVQEQLSGNVSDAGIRNVSGQVQSLIGQSVMLQDVVARLTEQIDASLARR